MPEIDRTHDDFDWLVQRYLDGAATPSEMKQLNDALRSDAMLRERLVDVSMQAQLMHEALAPSLVDDPALRFDPTAGDTARRSVGPWGMLAMAAAVALVASVATWFVAGTATHNGRIAGVPVAVTNVAVITDLGDAAWVDDESTATSPTIGEHVSGTLRLKSGTAQMLMNSGAVLTLMGPAEMTLTDATRCELHAGRLVVHCPKRAHGFVVDTDQMSVTDLGTTFGVSVDASGRSEVHVFEGVVTVANAATPAPVELTQGHALAATSTSAAPITTEADPWRFDRAAPLDVEALSVPDTYVAAINAASPAAYWRFERAAPLANSVPDAPPLTPMFRDTTPDTDATDNLRFDTAHGGFLYADGVFDTTRVGAASVAAGDYTLELWVRPDRPGQMTLISLLLPEIKDAKYWQHLSLIELQGQARGEVKPNADPSAIRFLHRDPPGPTGGTDVFSGGKYHEQRWNHIVGVRQGNAMTLYLNGGRVWSVQINDGPIDLSPFRVLIGKAHPVESPYRDVAGRIDELAVYAHALTEQQIKQHYRLIAGASHDAR
ncbi:MAG: hypothetical protein GC159_13525 [Phycisphaera sp.]|nr:hypothetical protein [Phycisphaera sp.]